MSKMNPQITTVEIGIRKVEIITMYPLSIADQFSMSELITEALQAFFNKKDSTSDDEQEVVDLPEQMKDIEFVSFCIDLIQTNLVKILTLVTDHTTTVKASKLLDKITNDQMATIATIIYQMNYENSLKNAVGLFQKVMSNLPGKTQTPSSKRPLPQSLNDTLNTDSNTSSDSATKTVD